MTIKHLAAVIVAICVITVIALLTFVPIYSKTVSGCTAKDRTDRSIVIAGDSKADVDQEVQYFISSSSKYDCPVGKVSFKLYVL